MLRNLNRIDISNRPYLVICLNSQSQDLLCNFVDNMSTWRKSVNFLFLSPNCSYQFNSRPVSVRFVSQTARNNQGIIAKKRTYIFRWRPRRASKSCRSSLLQFGSLVLIHSTISTRNNIYNFFKWESWETTYSVWLIFSIECITLKIVQLFRFADLNVHFQKTNILLTIF